MNCLKAKNIDLVQYLKKHGFEPQKIRGENVWFLSPFREEKTASFKVNSSKNIWYDFGNACGGTMIDFLQKYHDCSISEVLEILTSNNFSFQQQPRLISKLNKATIIRTKSIENKYLINYLIERNINLKFAKEFCCEVYYSFDSKNTFYAIGFKNDLKGFELRNKFFKGCVGKKHITTIKCNYNAVSVFESWSDFLSYLTLKNKIPKEDFLILNSTALIKNAIESLASYSIIKTFLDNDNSGIAATKLIQENCRSKVLNESLKFKKYNDVNDYLIAYRNKFKG